MIGCGWMQFFVEWKEGRCEDEDDNEESFMWLRLGFGLVLWWVKDDSEEVLSIL